MKTPPRPRMDVNLEELDQIIDGGMRAPLSESDGEKLKAVLHILAERAKPRWRTTEKTCAVLPPASGFEPSAEKPSSEGELQPTGHGRNGAARFTGARTVTVPHQTLHPGDACPECGVGKVYRQKEPKTLVRIVGRPPLEATRYEMERLRCNGCGEVFTAEEPAGAGTEKYDETAAAMIAQLRYGSGVPFQRLERLEGNLGIPLPAATQWEVAEKAALRLQSAYDEFIRQAARGEVMHNDDTGMRILRLAREPADPRTGIFTSGIVSLGPGWKIALYFSGAKHAGENLAEVLKRRPAGLAPLIQMCDALSWNTSRQSEGVERLLAHCMSHGRRQFVEVAENFPE
ncbi:MAG TPA: transposase, partial [Bryobacteraceae bacterium]